MQSMEIRIHSRLFLARYKGCTNAWCILSRSYGHEEFINGNALSVQKANKAVQADQCHRPVQLCIVQSMEIRIHSRLFIARYKGCTNALYILSRSYGHEEFKNENSLTVQKAYKSVLAGQCLRRVQRHIAHSMEIRIHSRLFLARYKGCTNARCILSRSYGHEEFKNGNDLSVQMAHKAVQARQCLRPVQRSIEHLMVICIHSRLFLTRYKGCTNALCILSRRYGHEEFKNGNALSVQIAHKAVQAGQCLRPVQRRVVQSMEIRIHPRLFLIRYKGCTNAWCILSRSYGHEEFKNGNALSVQMAQKVVQARQCLHPLQRSIVHLMAICIHSRLFLTRYKGCTNALCILSRRYGHEEFKNGNALSVQIAHKAVQAGQCLRPVQRRIVQSMEIRIHPRLFLIRYKGCTNALCILSRRYGHEEFKNGNALSVQIAHKAVQAGQCLRRVQRRVVQSMEIRIHPRLFLIRYKGCTNAWCILSRRYGHEEFKNGNALSVQIAHKAVQAGQCLRPVQRRVVQSMEIRIHPRLFLIRYKGCTNALCILSRRYGHEEFKNGNALSVQIAHKAVQAGQCLRPVQRRVVQSMEIRIHPRLFLIRYKGCTNAWCILSRSYGHEEFKNGNALSVQMAQKVVQARQCLHPLQRSIVHLMAICIHSRLFLTRYKGCTNALCILSRRYGHEEFKNGNALSVQIAHKAVQAGQCLRPVQRRIVQSMEIRIHPRLFLIRYKGCTNALCILSRRYGHEEFKNGNALSVQMAHKAVQAGQCLRPMQRRIVQSMEIRIHSRLFLIRYKGCTNALCNLLRNYGHEEFKNGNSLSVQKAHKAVEAGQCLCPVQRCIVLLMAIRIHSLLFLSRYKGCTNALCILSRSYGHEEFKNGNSFSVQKANKALQADQCHRPLQRRMVLSMEIRRYSRLFQSRYKGCTNPWYILSRSYGLEEFRNGNALSVQKAHKAVQAGQCLSPLQPRIVPSMEIRVHSRLFLARYKGCTNAWCILSRSYGHEEFKNGNSL